jgi:hypothetical protein
MKLTPLRTKIYRPGSFGRHEMEKRGQQIWSTKEFNEAWELFGGKNGFQAVRGPEPGFWE